MCMTLRRNPDEVGTACRNGAADLITGKVSNNKDVNA